MPFTDQATALTETQNAVRELAALGHELSSHIAQSLAISTEAIEVYQFPVEGEIAILLDGNVLDPTQQSLTALNEIFSSVTTAIAGIKEVIETVRDPDRGAENLLDFTTGLASGSIGQIGGVAAVGFLTGLGAPALGALAFGFAVGITVTWAAQGLFDLLIERLNLDYYFQQALEAASWQIFELRDGFQFVDLLPFQPVFGDDAPNSLEPDFDSNLFHAAGGDDTIFSGVFSDSILGGDGRDLLSYEDSGEAVFVSLEAGLGFGGYAEGDQLASIENLRGSDFDDILIGAPYVNQDGFWAANEMNGGPGNDSLIGLAGVDTLFGGVGDDFLSGGDQDDTLLGEWGNDTLVGGDSGDSLDGGAGIDLASYEDAGTGVRVALDQSLAGTGDAAGDRFTSVENLLGSSHADYLRGDGGNNSISGGSGADTLEGMAGSDTLTGGYGRDRFVLSANGFATITDYANYTAWPIGFSQSAGNVIDISAFVGGAFASGQTADDLVRVVREDVQSGLFRVEVNRDGLGINHGWEHVATLENPAGRVILFSLSGSNLPDAGVEALLGPAKWQISHDATVSESSGQIQITLQRPETDSIQTVWFSTDDFLANHGIVNDGDYVDVHHQQIDFVPGQETATVFIEILDDGVFETLQQVGIVLQDQPLPYAGSSIYDFTAFSFFYIEDDDEGTLPGTGTPADAVRIIPTISVDNIYVDRFDVSPVVYSGGKGSHVLLDFRGTLTPAYAHRDLFYVNDNTPNRADRIYQNDRVAYFENVEQISFFGSSANDRYSLDAQRAVVYGLDGDDEVHAGDGDDTIFGGAGNDEISPGGGRNFLDGGAGNDTISSGSWYRSPGVDTLLGGSGNDLIRDTGLVQGTQIDGGTGFDTADFTRDQSTVGETWYFNYPDHEVLLSDGTRYTGIDFIRHLKAGAGDDTLFIQTEAAEAPAGSAVIDLGGGTDLIVLEMEDEHRGVSMLSGYPWELRIGSGSQFRLYGIDGIERIFAETGDGSDRLLGFGLDDHLSSGAGNDFISGVLGNDTLIPGSGNDTVHGGSGFDLVILEEDLEDVAISFQFERLYIESSTGTKNFREIEEFQFNNAVLSFDQMYDLAHNETPEFIAPVGHLQMLEGAFSLNLKDYFFDLDGDELRFDGHAGTGIENLVIDPITGIVTGTGIPRIGYTSGIVVRATDTSGDVAYGQIEIEFENINQSPDLTLTFTGGDALWSRLQIADFEINDPDGRGTYSGNGYTWYRDGVEIAGEDTTYVTLTLDDIGHTFTVNFHYIDGFGTEELILSEAFVFLPEGEIIPFFGTEVDDSLNGTLVRDQMFGYSGADILNGYDGNDSLYGGADNDSLHGELGNDTLQGGDGNDILDGGEGDDSLNGGDGVDTLIGGTGDDFIFGGSTSADLRDVVYAGDGNDSVDGGYGNDELRGDAGNDSMEGGFGVDVVIGGDGDDVLTGSAWSDEIFGGNDNDFINGGFGHDRVNGGSGADRFFHIGIADHGSDWIQDYNAAEGDVLLYGGGVGAASASDFLIQRANTPNAGDAAISEVFVTHIPSGNLLWALVDGDAQTELMIRIGGVDYDLLA